MKPSRAFSSSAVHAPAPASTPVPHRRPRQHTRARSWTLHAGPNHSRYDHRQRPAQLDVRCPRCAGLTLATPMPDVHPAQHGMHIASDVGPLWNQPFQLRCTACLYRASAVPYERLPPLFHQISVSGRTLWAWNREHLDMLALALQGRDVRHHPYGFFATYIQRGWLQWRKKFSQAISRHLRKLAT